MMLMMMIMMMMKTLIDCSSMPKKKSKFLASKFKADHQRNHNEFIRKSTDFEIASFFRLTQDKAPLHQANLEKRENLMQLADASTMIYLQKESHSRCRK